MANPVWFVMLSFFLPLFILKLLNNQKQKSPKVDKKIGIKENQLVWFQN